MFEEQNTILEFCKYVQPIVSGCAGFIRTDGYMTHYPGHIILMNADESFVSIIKIPVIFDIKLTAIIGDFLKLKTEEEMMHLFDKIYFIGWNIKEFKMLNYANNYDILNTCQSEYSEEDCYNIPGFREGMSNSEIDFISIPTLDNENRVYRIPVSKAITNASKSDSISINIYKYQLNPNDQMLRTVRYTVFKKKFKLNIDIYFNIIRL